MDLPELCKYRYDPLNRLAMRGLAGRLSEQRFYRGLHVVTEVLENEQRCLFRSDDQMFAQKIKSGGETKVLCIASDQQNSALHASTPEQPVTAEYSPYGHRPDPRAAPGLPGFNGEQPDSVTGHYLLGSGYRAYNPVLMRFNSPDNLSPFGEGGLNPYSYCVGDPINRVDPTGHLPGVKAWVKFQANRLNPFKIKTSIASGVQRSIPINITDHMNTLPPEMIDRITSFASGPDVESLLQTNSRLKNIISDTSTMRFNKLMQTVGTKGERAVGADMVGMGEVNGIATSQARRSGYSLNEVMADYPMKWVRHQPDGLMLLYGNKGYVKPETIQPGFLERWLGF